MPAGWLKSTPNPLKTLRMMFDPPRPDASASAPCVPLSLTFCHMRTQAISQGVLAAVCMPSRSPPVDDAPVCVYPPRPSEDTAPPSVKPPTPVQQASSDGTPVMMSAQHWQQGGVAAALSLLLVCSWMFGGDPSGDRHVITGVSLCCHCLAHVCDLLWASTSHAGCVPLPLPISCTCSHPHLPS